MTVFCTYLIFSTATNSHKINPFGGSIDEVGDTLGKTMNLLLRLPMEQNTISEMFVEKREIKVLQEQRAQTEETVLTVQKVLMVYLRLLL